MTEKSVTKQKAEQYQVFCKHLKWSALQQAAFKR